VQVLLQGGKHHHRQQGLLYNYTRPDDHVGAGSQILVALWAEEVAVSRVISMFYIKFSDSYVRKKLHISNFGPVAHWRLLALAGHINDI